MLPTVQLAILAMLVSQTVMVVLMVMTPLHMDHQHHSRDSISMVIAMHTLGMFGLSALTGYLIDRFGRITMLLVGAIILIASALLAPASTNQYILALALFLLGLGWGEKGVQRRGIKSAGGSAAVVLGEFGEELGCEVL